MKTLALLISALLLFAVNAGATTIDFEDYAGGDIGTYYSGLGVTFNDTIGNDLRLQDWGHQSDGKGLAVFSDDHSRLGLTFDFDVNFLSFDFGNDDRGWIAPGQHIYLDLYKEGSFLGQFSQEVNANDRMDQSLAGSGLFDYAEIYYETALIEIIDNLEFTAAPVPEPSTLLLLGGGLLGLGYFGRKRMKS